MIERIYRLLELLAMFCLFHRMYREKMKMDILTVVFFSLDIIILEFANSQLAPAIFSLLVYIVTYIYLNMYYRQGLLKSLKVMISAIVVVSFLQLGIGGIFFWLFESRVTEEILVLCINMAILIIVCVVSQIKDEEAARNVLRWIGNNWLLSMYVVTLILFPIVLFKLNGKIKVAHALDVFFIVSVFVVAIIWWQKERAILEMEKRELYIQNIYQNTFEEMIREIRNRQHNFDNHLNAITNMYLNVESMDELIKKQSEYCKSIVSENRYNKIINDKSSPIIIGFLYHKFLHAEKSNINIVPRISIEACQCKMREYRLVEVLGIILDNAIEALENSCNKTIYFQMMEYKDKISIIVENPCAKMSREDIRKFFVEGYSSKGDGRGLGLPYVKKTVSKSDGKIMAENTRRDEVDWFSIKIELNK